MEQLHYDFDYMFKFVIIGDSCVGKSCILSRINNNQFKQQHEITLGVDLAIRQFTLNNKKLKIRIWDTAGQETFRSITRSYYRGAIGILLVYDITNRISFESIRSWHNEIKEYANENTRVILVANKTDLVKQRRVSAEEGQSLAQEISCAYIETSALSNVNIEQAFLNLSKQVLELIYQGKLDLEDKNCGVIVSTKSIPQQQCKC